MIQTSLYSQGDRRWNKKKLGSSGLTMGAYGCYTTSVAMMLNNYAIEVTPGELCDKLNEVGGYDADGQVIWQALTKLYPQVTFWQYISTTNHPGKGLEMQTDVAINKVRNALRLGQPVLLSVDNVGNDGWPDHAVVATHETRWDKGVDFSIHNPDGGKIESFYERYGDPMTKLYGYRVFIGPPIGFPEYVGYDDKLKAKAVWKLSQVLDKNPPKKLSELELGLYIKESLDHLI